MCSRKRARCGSAGEEQPPKPREAQVRPVLLQELLEEIGHDVEDEVIRRSFLSLKAEGIIQTQQLMQLYPQDFDAVAMPLLVKTRLRRVRHWGCIPSDLISQKPRKKGSRRGCFTNTDHRQPAKDFHDSLRNELSEMQGRLIKELRQQGDRINDLCDKLGLTCQELSPTVATQSENSRHEIEEQVPAGPEPGADWLIPGNYRVGELLGEGAYGTVRKGELLIHKKPTLVAIKRMAQIFTWSPEDCKRALREVAILAQLRHQNIVKICDVVAPSSVHTFDDVYMVMEACDSDLDKLFRTDVTLRADRIKKLLYTLLCGLKYLHSAGVWHRDLKPANCLFNQHGQDARKNWSIKICDFGLSRVIDGEPECSNPKRLRRDLTDHVVTRFWRAPELILLQRHYTQAIDMWSVGCIFAELLGMRQGIQVQDRGPLFLGSSCFPLSPDQRREFSMPPDDLPKQLDQLNMIFDLLGTPQPADIEQLGEDAKRYVRSFAAREGKGLHFPGVAAEAMDLLRRMLTFNPKARICAIQALQSNWFRKSRDQSREMVAPKQVTLEFEKEAEMGENRLRESFWKEVKKFHPEMQDMSE